MTRLPVHRFPDRTLPAQLLRTAREFGGKPFLHFFEPDRPEAPPRLSPTPPSATLTARAAAFLEAAGLAPGERVLLLAENSPEWLAVSLAAQALRAEPAGLFSVLSAEACASIALPGQAARRLRLQRGAVAQAGARRRRPRGRRAARRALAPAAPGRHAAGRAARRDGGRGAGRGRHPAGRLRRPRRRGDAGGPLPAPLHQRHHRPAEGGAARPAHHHRRHRLRRRRLRDHRRRTSASTCSPSATWPATTSSAWRWRRATPSLMIARKEDLPARAGALAHLRLLGAAGLRADPRPGPRRHRADALAAAPPPRRRAAGRRAGAGRRLDLRSVDRLLGAVASALVGGKLRRGLGGRVRGVFSGGAPAAPALFRFFEGLGIPFVELYGMTETAGLISHEPLQRPPPGRLGRPHHPRPRGPAGRRRRAAGARPAAASPATSSRRTTPAPSPRTASTGPATSPASTPTARSGSPAARRHLMVLSTGKKIAPEPIELAIASAAPFQGAVLLGEGRPFVTAAVFVAQEDLARLEAAGHATPEALLAVAAGRAGRLLRARAAQEAAGGAGRADRLPGPGHADAQGEARRR